MVDRYISSREIWLGDAVTATSAFIVAESAENAYDLVAAAPGTADYDRALDSEACLRAARRTCEALEAELTEIRNRSESARAASLDGRYRE